jgi:hypothetical protein
MISIKNTIGRSAGLVFGLLLLGFLTPAQAQTNFEMCQPTEPSPQASWKTSIEFQIDPDFSGFLTLSWVDFNGNLKFYQNMAAGDSYLANTFSGHKWVLSAKTSMFDAEPYGCAYFMGGLTPSIEEISSDNGSGEMYFSGSWEWKDQNFNRQQAGNLAFLSFTETGDYEYCYNDICTSGTATSHGEYMSFEWSGQYFEFYDNQQTNNLDGSFWGSGTNRDGWPQATISMQQEPG